MTKMALSAGGDGDVNWPHSAPLNRTVPPQKAIDQAGCVFFQYPTPPRCAAAQPRVMRVAPAEAARHGISQSRITFVTKPSTSAITMPKPHRR
jgi:hypothetical protein